MRTVHVDELDKQTPVLIQGRHFDRALRPVKADERLGMRLCVLHNLFFYNELTARMREEIERGSFESFYLKYRDILGEFAED